MGKLKEAGSYMILRQWERITQILKNGDTGPWQAIFGGEHTSQPTLGKIGDGDTIYPISVNQGNLWLLGRMTISHVVDPNPWIEKMTGIDPKGIMWDTYWDAHKKTVTHLIPITCVNAAALTDNGTPIGRWLVPPDTVARLRLGPAGKEQPIKTNDGKVASVSLQGHFRRLTPSSVALLDDVLSTGDPS